MPAGSSPRAWTPPATAAPSLASATNATTSCLIEAGFAPARVVQIMSANGAKILGVYDRLGSVERGKTADLVVMRGDLAADPTVIRNVTVVFKDGIGYDSAKLIAAVKGRVGID
ncbi:MAG TPA: amidohydrolase family protein [Gemmatimonadaceae bacterium]|nr:amidohydrolase family protein [Gemmatimonadaceae bacterium]